MSITNVSTYTSLQTTLGNVSKIEADLLNQQQQLSSGNKSSDFTGMAGDTQQYLSLDHVLAKTDQYLSDNHIVETRINATDSALSQIITVATGLQSLLAQRLTGTSNNASYQTQLSGMWQQIAGQLNTSINNNFLFSGTKTNTPPVDPTTFPTLRVPNTPDTGYYNGSRQDFTAMMQDNTSVTYNVRADNPALEKIIAGLSMAKMGDANGSNLYLQQAEDLVQGGLQDLIGVKATLGAASAQFSTVDTNLTNQKLYWKGIQENIGNTDIVSVSTQVAINQGILQAAFQVFAKISSLRLADYLK